MGYQARFSIPAAILLIGCNTNTSPDLPPGNPPPLGAACSPADTIRLAVLDGITVDCSAGTTITVEGNGAVYLVVPQFAAGGVGQVDYDSLDFSLHLGGGRSPALASRWARAAAGRARSPQLSLDRALRRRAHRLAPAARRLGAMVRGAARAAAAPPAVGDTRSFQVLADTAGTTYRTISAVLRFVGQNVLVYLDGGAPTPGFSDADLATFGQLIDQTMYGIVTSTFGAPTDIDQNGHAIMLLTPAVNALTTPLGCQSAGFVTGFFDGIDFTGDANSNQGEVFYALVPDPNGSVSCAHTATDVAEAVPAVFLHEMQHMISFGQHVLVQQGPDEEGWLDEGLSRVAEEEGARYYEARFPAPTGRTSPTQIFPDSAEAFISNLLVDSYDFLLLPDSVSLTLHSDADDGLAWRAGDWLLLRYVGDQKGEAVYRALEETPLVGIDNLAAATGQPFPSLFADFGVALFVDSLPGIARSAIPARYRFTSRNLRLLYNAVYQSLGPQNGIPSPFPIFVNSFTPNNGLTGTMVPGTATFFGLTTDQDAPGVAIQFGPGSGEPFPAALHPQVSLFRIQ